MQRRHRPPKGTILCKMTDSYRNNVGVTTTCWCLRPDGHAGSHRCRCGFRWVTKQPERLQLAKAR